MTKIVHQPASGKEAPDAAPLDSLSVADIGDVHNNTNNLHESVRIKTTYDALLQHLVIPLTLGDGPTITSPNLRALECKHGLIGLLHVDAHPRTHEEMFGEMIAHGTTLRRAVRKGLLDGCRAVLAGQRAKGYFLNTPKCTKGSVLLALPAALPGLNAPRRAGVAARSQCGHRQPARVSRRGRHDQRR